METDTFPGGETNGGSEKGGQKGRMREGSGEELMGGGRKVNVRCGY